MSGSELGMAPVTSKLRTAPLKGIVLVLCACVLFACMDTAGKYLMTKYNVPFVAAVRYGINLILLLALAGPHQGAALWRSSRLGLVVLRSFSLAVATFFAGLALQRMPVGETVAIFYLQGFGVLLAAGYFLKERVTLFGWLAAIVGFAGVLLIVRPGSSLPPLGVVFALICSAVSVVYILLSRVLAATENTVTLLFHVAIAGVFLFGLLLPFHWTPISVGPLDAALLGFMGVASLTGHYLLTAAYRFAPASRLAPFNYFHIAFAVLLSWLVYNHVPDGFALSGMAMIAIAGAGIAIHAHITRASVSLTTDHT
jgi:drug/metabolite transporter (DMT)-like permease